MADPSGQEVLKNKVSTVTKASGAPGDPQEGPLLPGTAALQVRTGASSK